MKKMMMVAAAVAMAFASQAANVDWSVNKQSFYWVDATSSSKTYAAGETEYLLVFATEAAADALYASMKDGSVKIADVVGMSSDYLVTSATGGTGTKKGQITVNKFASSKVTTDMQYYTTLVYDGDNFLMSSAVEGYGYTDEGEPVIFTSSAFADATGTNYGVTNTRTGWTTAAPEPTSGLLLLVGGALLGLRRRRA